MMEGKTTWTEQLFTHLVLYSVRLKILGGIWIRPYLNRKICIQTVIPLVSGCHVTDQVDDTRAAKVRMCQQIMQCALDLSWSTQNNHHIFSQHIPLPRISHTNMQDVTIRILLFSRFLFFLFPLYFWMIWLELFLKVMVYVPKDGAHQIILTLGVFFFFFFGMDVKELFLRGMGHVPKMVATRLSYPSSLNNEWWQVMSNKKVALTLIILSRL